MGWSIGPWIVELSWVGLVGLLGQWLGLVGWVLTFDCDVACQKWLGLCCLVCQKSWLDRVVQIGGRVGLTVT